MEEGVEQNLQKRARDNCQEAESVIAPEPIVALQPTVATPTR